MQYGKIQLFTNALYCIIKRLHYQSIGDKSVTFCSFKNCNQQFARENSSSLHPSLSPFSLSLPQNGFWLALGWCAIFLIPVAIFAIITSQYYRKMRYDDDLAVPYDDSFP